MIQYQITPEKRGQRGALELASSVPAANLAPQLLLPARIP